MQRILTPLHPGASGSEGVDITSEGYARGSKGWSHNDHDNQLEAAFDGNVSTYYVSSSHPTCSLEWHLPPSVAADIFAVKIHPVSPSQKWDGHSLIRGGVIEGTTGEEGAPWVRLVVIPQNIRHGWSTYAVQSSATTGVGATLYRKIRFVKSGGARCRVAEMRLVGEVRHGVVGGQSFGGDSPSCALDVVVVEQGANMGPDAVRAVIVLPVATPTNSNTSSNTSSTNGRTNTAGGMNFTYARSTTPFVASISPAEGTTGGGTSLTITGTGLSVAATIAIDGILCAVNASLSNATVVICVTGRRATHVSPPTVVVLVPGAGAAAVAANTIFMYVDRWSSPGTWGGAAPPVEGDTVGNDHGVDTVTL
jgi:hypothetical protein